LANSFPPPGWLGFLCTELPGILAQRSDVLSLRTIRIIQDQAWVWRRLNARIEGLSTDITTLVKLEPKCARLKTLPGARPITSSVMLAAIGTGDVFSKGLQFRRLRNRTRHCL
jgi:transposase